jgi:hypothetical protein
MLDLTCEELATAAQACRAQAVQEEKRAAGMENPSVRRTVEGIAKRYRLLAEKLEAARKRA